MEGVTWSMNINAPLIITQSMTNSKVLVYEVLCCIIFQQTRDILSLAAYTPTFELALEKLFV